MNGYPFMRSNSLHDKAQLFKEKKCTYRDFFFLRVYPIQESKEKVTQVVPLFKKRQELADFPI